MINTPQNRPRVQASRYLWPGLLLTALLTGSLNVNAASLNLSTYYPAPSATFDRFRLVPRVSLGALGSPCESGMLYLEAIAGQQDLLRYCVDDATDSGTGTWGTLQGVWTQSGTTIYPSGSTIDPDVNIGIGTTTPSSTMPLTVVSPGFDLQVEAANVRGESGHAGIGLFKNDLGTEMQLVYRSNDEMAVHDPQRNYDRLTVSRSGDITLGCTWCSAADLGNPVLTLQGWDSSAGAVEIANLQVNSSGDLRLAAATDKHMLLNSQTAGWVGVGTDAPQSGLHIHDALNVDWVTPLTNSVALRANLTVSQKDAHINMIAQDHTVWSSGIKFTDVDAAGDFRSQWSIWKATTNAPGNNPNMLLFSFFDPTSVHFSPETKMTLTPNGQLGIGTNPPRANVHVQGTGEIILYDQDMYLGLWGDTDEDFAVANGQGDLEFISYDASSASPPSNFPVIFDKNGNVIVGATTGCSSTAPLCVKDLPDGMFTPVVVDSNGNFYKQPPSSRRYKTDIRPFRDEFTKILALTPQAFRYKSTGQPNIGYMAEDLDAMGLNALVSYNETGQPEGVQYHKLPIYIIETMKSQRDRMQHLKEEVVELKAAFQYQQEQLRRLRSQPR